MPRVKRGVTARARHKKVMKLAKGYYGARSRSYKTAKQAVITAGPVCVPRPTPAQAAVPCALDHPDQRSGARTRFVV